MRATSHSRKPATVRRLHLTALGVVLAAAIGDGVRAQPPPVSPDDFVAVAGGADQYEIMAGRLAMVQATDPALRAFAAEMVRDHGAAFEALSQAAVRDGLKPPSTSVGGDQVMLLAGLQGARGEELNRLYTRQQRLAHVAALTTERDYASMGSDQRLRAAAQADLPMIERHLRTAESLSRPDR